MIEIVSDSAARAVMDMRAAIPLIEEMFASLARGTCEVFPVVQGRGAQPGERFGVKSGSLRGGALLGLKVGSYWPRNVARDLPNHESTTLLLDSQTGFPRALVAAGYLNALRTAAADGVAIKHLARADARSVGIVGAGHQSWFELRAAACVRAIAEVRVWNRNAARAEAFAERVRTGLELNAHTASIEETSASDIVITCTASRGPLVWREWVSAGAHISAMGADGPGKQELDVALVRSGRLFADVVEQSITLGEFEQTVKEGLVRPDAIHPVGDVIVGRVAGREREDQITIFDSSGIALQDLVIAEAALEAARRKELVQVLEF